MEQFDQALDALFELGRSIDRLTEHIGLVIEAIRDLSSDIGSDLAELRAHSPSGRDVEEVNRTLATVGGSVDRLTDEIHRAGLFR